MILIHLKPFINSTIIFWSKPKTPWWKVFDQYVVPSTYDHYIDTHGNVPSLQAPI
jgi:hypothetical protein